MNRAADYLFLLSVSLALRHRTGNFRRTGTPIEPDERDKFI
jgi:hypothetical protein